MFEEAEEFKLTGAGFAKEAEAEQEMNRRNARARELTMLAAAEMQEDDSFRGELEALEESAASGKLTGAELEKTVAGLLRGYARAGAFSHPDLIYLARKGQAKKAAEADGGKAFERASELFELGSIGPVGAAEAGGLALSAALGIEAGASPERQARRLGEMLLAARLGRGAALLRIDGQESGTARNDPQTVGEGWMAAAKQAVLGEQSTGLSKAAALSKATGLLYCLAPAEKVVEEFKAAFGSEPAAVEEVDEFLRAVASTKGKDVTEVALKALDPLPEAAKARALAILTASGVVDGAKVSGSSAWTAALSSPESATEMAWSLAEGAGNASDPEAAWAAIKAAERSGADLSAQNRSGATAAGVFASQGAKHRAAAEKGAEAERSGSEALFEKSFGASLRDWVDEMAPSIGDAWSPVGRTREYRLARAADALMARRGFPGLLGSKHRAWEKEDLARELREEVLAGLEIEMAAEGRLTPESLAKAQALGDVAEMLERSGCKKFDLATKARDKLFGELAGMFEELASKASEFPNWAGSVELGFEAIRHGRKDEFEARLDDLFVMAEGDDALTLLGRIRGRARGYFERREKAKELHEAYGTASGISRSSPDDMALASMLTTLHPEKDWSEAPPSQAPDRLSADGKEIWPRDAAYEMLSACALASRGAYEGEDESLAAFFAKARPLSADELGLPKEGSGKRGPWKLDEGVFTAGKIGRAVVGVAEVNGKATVILAARGTQPKLTKIPEIGKDYAAIWRHAEHFEELARACQDWAEKTGARLVVSGHSLGGAAAETMMRSLPLADAAIVFGSPGTSVAGPSEGGVDKHALFAEEGAGLIDERIFSLSNELDPVPKLGAWVYKSSAGGRLGRGPSVGPLSAFSKLVREKSSLLKGIGLVGGALGAAAAPVVAAVALPAFSLVASRLGSHSIKAYQGNAGVESERWEQEKKCRAWARPGVRRPAC